MPLASQGPVPCHGYKHLTHPQRARDLFYAMWVPDLFMKRVENNEEWSLMCPHECPGLSDCWGDEFEELYVRYEKEGRARRSVKAQKLWFAILESQTETGTPYMVYKDHCNRKSNQQVGRGRGGGGGTHRGKGEGRERGTAGGRMGGHLVSAPPPEPWHHQVQQPVH